MSPTMQQTEDQVLSLPDFSAIAPEDQVAPLPPRRPWWRRRRGIITIILIALLILAGFLAFFLYLGRQRPITYQFQQAIQGNFSLTVSATGPLQSAIYNLVFTGTGTISEIDVTVGQTVTKGQVLAKLNKTSLQDAVNTAQAGVLSAQTGVNTAQANLNKAQAQSNANVQSAQVTLNNAQASLGTTQTQSQTGINTAQTTLSNDQTSLSHTQAQSAANNSAAQTTLSNAQTSLSHTQTQSAASIAAAQTTLSNAQTSLSHTQAQSAASIAAAQTTLSNAQMTMAQDCPPVAPITASDCATATAAVKTAQSQLTLTETQASANNAAAQATVNTAQQQLTVTETQASASNATAQGNVTSAQKQLTVTETTSTSTNAAAQAKITNDQQSVTSAMAQANSNNTTAQNTVNAATSSLATAQAMAATSVTSQQGLVKTAQSTLQTNLVALQTAQHNLANATLLAPHEGIVTTINGTVGGTPGAPASASVTTSSASGNTFIQIADVSTLQVLAAVNESDTANLKVGDPARFTVSAYGNRLFTGTVSAISPVGQTVSNVVSYPVTIDVNKDDLQNTNLLPGMTASVTIVVVQRPNVVLIPVTAINFARTATGTVNGIPPLITTQQASAALAQARQMRTELINQNPAVAQDNPIPAYVIEQPAGQTAFITVPVVLGLTDDTYYVVLQGLSPGDIIVVGAQRG